MKFYISDNIKKYYPTAEECRVNNNLLCTEEGCSSVFISESNLNLHLAKTHKKSTINASDSLTKQYFCPELGCAYNVDKFFKELKVLRTHFMMQHAPEPFVCLRCQKIFPLQKILKRHTEYCGVEFTCPVCKVTYPIYETLQTHGRRKKHHIPSKSNYKLGNVKSESKNEPNITQRRILPKSSLSLILFPSSGIMKISQESQTFRETPKCKSKMTQVCHQLDPSKYTRQTQTGFNKHLTVETQTIGDYISVPKKSLPNFNDIPLTTSITQTDLIESKNSACNTQFEGVPLLKDTEISSSGTQTGEINTNNHSSTHTHDSIYTDTSDLDLTVNMGSFEFDNCHMETQTDFILEDVMFGCDYTSNMYTQTCDQILTDLGFNDIHTQTALDDVLKSVESQTVMSRKRPEIGNRDMSHIETQTDAEYREMLEVINS